MTSQVSRAHVAEVIARMTMDGHDRKQLAGAIADYLLEEGLTGELESLMRDVMQYRINKGAVEARVVSAHELTEEVLDDVKKLLGKEYSGTKAVELDTELDPAVVGGVRINLPNEQLDLTVKAKLDTFKRLTIGGA